jgi:hypothetical protein
VLTMTKIPGWRYDEGIGPPAHPGSIGHAIVDPAKTTAALRWFRRRRFDVLGFRYCLEGVAGILITVKNP